MEKKNLYKIDIRFFFPLFVHVITQVCTYKSIIVQPSAQCERSFMILLSLL